MAVKRLRALAPWWISSFPNRFEYGYGLTPEIVELAATAATIADHRRQWHCQPGWRGRGKRRGIEVLITDHHLPGDSLPDALIVNPNPARLRIPEQKNLAGVGDFHVMLALRAELRQRGTFGDGNGPNLGELLDLVALGTVADVVKLDANNRILVEQGLARDARRQGQCRHQGAVPGCQPQREARMVCFDLALRLAHA